MDEDVSYGDVYGNPPAAVLSMRNPDLEFLRGLQVPPGLKLDW
jgi:hypothetical protein